MVDIHSHLLYGIDDGAKNLDQTEKMIDQAVKAGLTDLIVTPHINEFCNSEYLKKIENKYNEITTYLSDQHIDLKIHRAAEILLDSKFSEWISNSDLFMGRKKDYLLFELPHFIKPEEISKSIFSLKLKNITPILAHPERSPIIMESPSYIEKWIDQGCIMQMNAGSIIGQFGKNCEAFSKRLLDARMIHLFASDAHENKHRNYKILKEASDVVNQYHDKELADILFNQNPKNILNSKSVKIFKTITDNLKGNPIKFILNKLKIKFK